MTILTTIQRLYSDPEYFRQLFRIALPIALQSLVMSLLNMATVVMVGQNGDIAVASVGLNGQVFFLFNIILFGVGSGAAMFTAQLWGKRDLASMRKVLGLCLAICLLVAAVFISVSQTWPEGVIRIYSNDPDVIALGSKYLKLLSFSFPFFAITFSYSVILRSTGDVRAPLLISAASLGIGAALTYGLIFGKFGLPGMGVMGAAIATIAARCLESILMVTSAYLRHTPLAASWKELTGFSLGFAGKVIVPVLPVIANETLWAFGVTTYNIIYGHIGTEALAAMNIVATIDNLGLVFFFGLTHATAALIGNRIGAGLKQEAVQYAARSLGIGASLAILMGLLLLVIRGPILSLYDVSPQVVQYTYRILNVISLFLWVRVVNMVIIVGILRSGGDTVFSMFLDGFVIWIVGVPLAALGAFILGLPVYWVYLMVMAEEVCKLCVGLWRFTSRKWIHDLADTVQEPAAV